MTVSPTLVVTTGPVSMWEETWNGRVTAKTPTSVTSVNTKVSASLDGVTFQLLTLPYFWRHRTSDVTVLLNQKYSDVICRMTSEVLTSSYL